MWLAQEDTRNHDHKVKTFVSLQNMTEDLLSKKLSQQDISVGGFLSWVYQLFDQNLMLPFSLNV